MPPTPGRPASARRSTPSLAARAGRSPARRSFEGADLAPALASGAIEPTVVFPHGLVGCEAWKRFVLVTEAGGDLPVGSFECLDEPGVSLTVAPAALVDPAYQPRLSAADRAALGLGPHQEPVLYCTLTLGQDGWITANLLGPLAINPALRLGRQVVLAESGYSPRHPVAHLATGADPCSS